MSQYSNEHRFVDIYFDGDDLKFGIKLLVKENNFFQDVEELNQGNFALMPLTTYALLDFHEKEMSDHEIQLEAKLASKSIGYYSVNDHLYKVVFSTDFKRFHIFNKSFQFGFRSKTF